jgi:SAM-dependent methyltransferase
MPHDTHCSPGPDDNARHHPLFESPEAAAYAELEGEALAELTNDAITTLVRLCDEHTVTVQRVLDLGCGPGVGTAALAHRFGRARVVAVDGSAAMLERAGARLARLGLVSRVELSRAELPADLESLEPADVVWGSMVLHHLGDETDALRRIGALVAPSGLLAIVERGRPLRVLPTGAERARPGITARIDAAWTAWFDDMRARLPGATTSAPYRAMFEVAGFELVADLLIERDLDPSAEPTQRFVREHLARTRAQLAAHADAADLALLDRPLGPHAGTTRASRHLYVGRRSQGSPGSPDA